MAQQQNNETTRKTNPATDMPKKDFGVDRDSDKAIKSPKRDTDDHQSSDLGSKDDKNKAWK